MEAKLCYQHAPPRQAPMAKAKMRGFTGRFTSASWLRLMRTGIWERGHWKWWRNPVLLLLILLLVHTNEDRCRQRSSKHCDGRKVLENWSKFWRTLACWYDAFLKGAEGFNRSFATWWRRSHFWSDLYISFQISEEDCNVEGCTEPKMSSSGETSIFNWKQTLICFKCVVNSAFLWFLMPDAHVSPTSALLTCLDMELFELFPSYIV